MDDAYFRTFLEEQHAVLADFDAQIQAQAAQIATSPDAGRQSSSRLHAELLAQDRLLQTRFEDACRRLADVYMASDPGQRAAIRRLVENFRAVLACIGIPAEQIRTKIDGVRFQLALVYESIKDLRPDAEDAVLQLERLCRAAQAAGFDSNPHLREVADASSDAMRKLLLGNLVDQRGTIRCKRCNRRYKEDLPRCPFCGAANPRYIEPAHLDGSHGAPATAFEEDEGPWYYLPLLKALPFMLWSSGGCISLLVAVFLLALAVCGWVVAPVPFASWASWVLWGFVIAVFGLDRWIRRAAWAQPYFSKSGRSRVLLTPLQSLLSLLIWLLLLAAIIAIVVAGFQPDR